MAERLERFGGTAPHPGTGPDIIIAVPSVAPGDLGPAPAIGANDREIPATDIAG